MEETEFIWMDGALVKWKDAKIHVLTHTLHYGLGVFEGIRVYYTEQGPAIFKLKEHIERLFKSAEKIQMQIPFTQREIIEATKETVKVNNLHEGYIRPIAYYGYGKMGLGTDGAPVDFAIACWPWGSYLGEEPIKVKVSNFIRIHPKSTHADAKVTGHYVNSILAGMEAKRAGYDEALILDYQGNVVEGPGENFFIVKNRKIYTPPLGNILPGITRASVIEIAREEGYSVEERVLTLAEAKSADEAFFTGTAAEVTAIRQIDDSTIGNGKIGSVTHDIREKFFEIVHGTNKKYERWISYISQ